MIGRTQLEKNSGHTFKEGATTGTLCTLDAAVVPEKRAKCGQRQSFDSPHNGTSRAIPMDVEKFVRSEVESVQDR